MLVIDDEFDSRVLLAHRLQELGYKVIRADRGAQGLQMARELHPHLIPLDLLIPEMAGSAFLDALQRDARYRDIPVVVLAAKDLSAEERASLRQRIAGLLRKSGDLRAALERLLGDLLPATAGGRFFACFSPDRWVECGLQVGL